MAEDAWYAVQQCLALRPQDAIAALQSSDGPAAALQRCDLAPPVASQVAASRRAHERVAARLVCFGADDYPERLKRLVDAPPVLSLRGDSQALAAPAVAIVGARAATAYGLSVAGRVASAAAAAGLVVISGLARGIDRAAHVAALDAGGRTVAVQACGIDRVYPAEHRKLAERIAGQGALVSELPPGTPPRAPYFPLRNRIISRLALAVVVVEARERSGTLVTAKHALDQGVDVLAVPGPIDVATSRGSNQLLRDGAQPLLEPGDLLAAIGVAAGTTAGLRGAEALALTPAQGALVRALAAAPSSNDELVRTLGRPAAEVAADLFELELLGALRADRDGRWRLSASAREG